MDLSNEKEGNNIDLKNLSTIQKILILQRLLKEMTSIKKRFMSNKNNMLQKLDSFCFNYFKILSIFIHFFKRSFPITYINSKIIS